MSRRCRKSACEKDGKLLSQLTRCHCTSELDGGTSGESGPCRTHSRASLIEGAGEACAKSTHVLVRDNLDILHMSGSLKDLPQDLLSDPWVQTTHVQGSLVRLRGSAPNGAAGAHRRGHAVGVGHVPRKRIGVLGDVQAERWLRWHALAVAILEGSLAGHSGRHGEGGTRVSVVGHCDNGVYRRERWRKMQGSEG